jgi:probable phosphoglycerate mutase
VVTAFGRIPAQHPDHPIAPGAETWTAYLQRATATLRDILARHSGGTVLIVGVSPAL